MAQRRSCVLLTVLLMQILLSPGSQAQNATVHCEDNWCGEKWKDIDRILHYDYHDELTTRTITYNRTVTKLNCSEVDIVLNPNTDGCRFVNVTQEESMTIFVNEVVRAEKPEVKELPRELTLGIIATDNVDIYGNFTQEQYPARRDKIWQIWVPRGCRMVMYFGEFDTESSLGCENDYFSVQTKKNHPTTRYCGGLTSVPEKIEVANKRRVQMVFHADESNFTLGRGVHATFCFQKLKEFDPDYPCSCNADTSSLKKRGAKQQPGAHGHHHHDHDHSSTAAGEERTRSKSKRSGSRSGSRSTSTKRSKRKMSKKDMRRLMAQQDEEIGQYLMDMMKNGLRAINQYRYSGEESQRTLAEKYQEALSTSLV